jgi:hypothetical protein
MTQLDMLNAYYGPGKPDESPGTDKADKDDDESATCPEDYES